MNDDLDTSHDPPRLDLSDDAPEIAARAMRAARSDVPKPEDLSRMEALLMARIAALGAGGAGGAGAGGSGGASGASGATSATGASGAGTSAGSAAAAGTSAAVGGTSTFATLAGGAAVLALVGAAFVGKSWLSGSAPASSPSGMTSPVPCVAVAPSTTPLPSASLSSVPVVTLDDLPRAPSGSSTVQKAPVATPVVDEAAETKLLGDAQSSVKSDPAAALRACNEHAKRFPGGSLAQEREALAIEALVRLGRKGEAEQRLTRFRANYPSSGHLRKLEGLL